MRKPMRPLARVAGVLALGCLVSCHEQDRLDRVEATAAFEPAILDFGEVPVGEWRAAEVEVRNVSDVPFRVVEALGLLKNPSFVIELAPVMLRPSQVAKVRVRFHPLKEGELTENLNVLTDADREGLREVPVLGRGTPAPVRIFPDRIDFETLEIDSERVLSVTVENPVDIPLLVQVVGDSHLFSTDAQQIAPFSTQKLQARFRPTRVGPAAAEIHVLACAACTSNEVSLTGQAVYSAFTFEPSPVFFELVPVHEKSRAKTTATNITWRPVEVLQARTNEGSFSSLVAPDGKIVHPGQSFELELEFSARSSNAMVGVLEVDYLSDRQRLSGVELDARGGGPRLAIAPASIDFGELPVGGKLERVVRVSNAGVDGELHLLGVRASGEVMDFSVSAPYRGKVALQWANASLWPWLQTDSGGLPIAPGEDAIDLRVYFQPTRPGELSAQLEIVSDGRFEPTRVVTLTGRARSTGPCVFRVLPSSLLDFGNVPAGSGAVLGFRFENTGDEECAVKDIHLSNDAGGVFFLPGGPLTGGVVIKDDSFAAQIAFKSKSSGEFHGELAITVSDPSKPDFRLPLLGKAYDSCLVASPPYLDFGAIRYDCSATPRRTLVTNACAAPVTVERIWLGEGTSSQFALSLQPSLPLLLAPAEAFELEGTYARAVHGQHFTPLFLQAQGEPAPLLIPMLAETNHEGVEHDTFVQGTDRKLDVLVVISNATTMGTFQSRLASEVDGWLTEARSQGIEMRVGVTTTGLVPRSACPGAAQGGEAGRLVPVDGSAPRVVSSTSSSAASALAQNLKVGECHNLVQGLETMRAALGLPLIDAVDDPRTAIPDDGNAGFLRASARLAVLFVADEDDHSGFPVDSYAQFLGSLKGRHMGHRITAYAIIPTDSSCSTAGPPGPRITGLVAKTGGAVRSICEPSYRPLLNQLTARAAGVQADFTLSATPSDPSQLLVTVNGSTSPPGSWSYDPARNTVVFAPGQVPAPGQTIQVHYRAECRAN